MQIIGLAESKVDYIYIYISTSQYKMKYCDARFDLYTSSSSAFNNTIFISQQSMLSCHADGSVVPVSFHYSTWIQLYMADTDPSNHSWIRLLLLWIGSQIFLLNSVCSVVMEMELSTGYLGSCYILRDGFGWVGIHFHRIRTDPQLLYAETFHFKMRCHHIITM